jgi:hypothetical protein
MGLLQFTTICVAACESISTSAQRLTGSSSLHQVQLEGGRARSSATQQQQQQQEEMPSPGPLSGTKRKQLALAAEEEKALESPVCSAPDALYPHDLWHWRQ